MATTVDYSVPLPYALPAQTDPSYSFLAVTIGDAYRRAVRGDANWFAWIQAAATIPDAQFHAAGLDYFPNARDAFRAAWSALQNPGGSTVTQQYTITDAGAAIPVPSKAAPAGDSGAFLSPQAPSQPPGSAAADLVAATAEAVAPVNPDGTTSPVVELTPASAPASAGNAWIIPAAIVVAALAAIVHFSGRGA